MKLFSLPSDFNKQTIDKYDHLNNKYSNARVFETYGNITIGNIFGSGRLAKQMYKFDFTDLKDYIGYSKSKNIGFNYTVNAPFMQNMEFEKEGIDKIYDFLDKLYKSGVRDLTITLPSIIELVKNSGYDFFIKSSTICQITNVVKALSYKDMGINRIVVDESKNRDFGTLKRIREAFGQEVEIIINQICDLNCVYRIFHYNMISGEPFGLTNNTSINFYEHRCVLQQLKDISNLLKLSWIRPEDLHYYENIGIKYFKLQGRHTFIKGGNPIRTVEAYFKESFDGDLMDLLTMFAQMNSFKIKIDNKKLDGFIKPFYDVENFCEFDCTKCSYCSNFSKNVFNYDDDLKVIDKAKKFYTDVDEFKNLIRNHNDNKNHDKIDMTITKSSIIKDKGDFAF